MSDYGSCVKCVSDLNGRGETVKGLRAIAESIARRLTTPRGRLIGDPNYGIDVTEYLNADLSRRDVAELRSAIISECLKDERVEEITVEVTIDASDKMTIAIQFVGADGPFEFVLSVNELSVEILRKS